MYVEEGVTAGAKQVRATRRLDGKGAVNPSHSLTIVVAFHLRLLFGLV